MWLCDFQNSCKWDESGYKYLGWKSKLVIKDTKDVASKENKVQREGKHDCKTVKTGEIKEKKNQLISNQKQIQTEISRRGWFYCTWINENLLSSYRQREINANSLHDKAQC